MEVLEAEASSPGEIPLPISHPLFLPPQILSAALNIVALIGRVAQQEGRGQPLAQLPRLLRSPLHPLGCELHGLWLAPPCAPTFLLRA